MRSRDCAGLSFPASSPRPTETLRAPAEPRSRRRDRHDDTEDPLTPDDYLARVRALLPAVGERAVRAEQLRRLPDETFKDFQAAGLFRCIQPKRYEGYELDRSEERRVGKECRSGWWPVHSKKHSSCKCG